MELGTISNGDGSTGFVVNGVTSLDYSDWAVGSVGDGFDDLLIAAFSADPETGKDRDKSGSGPGWPVTAAVAARAGSGEVYDVC